MNGVPAARAPPSATWNPGRSSSSRSSAGNRNVMASVEAGASPASWRRVAAIETGRDQLLPPRPARLEVDRDQSQPLRDAEAQLDQSLALPGLGTGLIDLEHPEAGGDLRPALGEGIQTCTQDNVLGDASAGLLDHQILDEPSTGDNG